MYILDLIFIAVIGTLVGFLIGMSGKCQKKTINKVHFLNSTYADSNGPTFCILRVVISLIVLTDVIDIITNLMVCQCKDCANREQNIKLA